MLETLEGVELVTEPQTGGKYYLYVPKNYDAEKAWPLVVTCHGTEPYDTAARQAKEWKALAVQLTLICSPGATVLGLAVRVKGPPPPAAAVTVIVTASVAVPLLFVAVSV